MRLGIGAGGSDTCPGKQVGQELLFVGCQRPEQRCRQIDRVDRLLFVLFVICQLFFEPVDLALQDARNGVTPRRGAAAGVAQRLEVPLQRGQKSLRRGQQALLEQLEDKLTGEALLGIAGPALTLARVLSQLAVGLTLGIGVMHLDRIDDALWVAGSAIPARRQFALEPAHHHGGQLLGVGPDATRETLVVEQLEQRRKGLGIPVVRGGREEQLVLEMRRNGANGGGALRVGGVAPGARGGDVVRLVNHQHVETPGIDGFARGGQHLLEQAQRTLTLEEIDAGDQAREMIPGVDVQATRAAQLTHQLGIDDAKVQPELVAHLVAPLDLDRRWADHEHRAHAMAQRQLLDHQAGFDRLAEAHVIGDQQVDTRHLDCTDQRVELVVLDLHAAAERCLQ